MICKLEQADKDRVNSVMSDITNYIKKNPNVVLDPNTCVPQIIEFLTASEHLQISMKQHYLDKGYTIDDIGNAVDECTKEVTNELVNTIVQIILDDLHTEIMQKTAIIIGHIHQATEHVAMKKQGTLENTDE